MKKNGFIASALLYGMLALFLVIMMSTLYVLANNKLAMDKLKAKALKEVSGEVDKQNLSDVVTLTTEVSESEWKLTVDTEKSLPLEVKWYYSSENSNEIDGAVQTISSGLEQNQKILSVPITDSAINCPVGKYIFAVITTTDPGYVGQAVTDAKPCPVILDS